MPPTIIYEYKTVSIFPEGIRVKGDDVTEKLTDLLNTRCNEYAEDGWHVISIVPSMKSEGAVAKLMVTFERKKEGESL